MSITQDLKRYGKASLMVWIPQDLHQAFKIKLAQRHLTAQEVVAKMLTVYTQFERKPDPEGGTHE
jgi:hypothetical protein